MWGASEFECSETVTHGEGYFIRHSLGVRCDYGAAKDMPVAVGEKLNKTMTKIKNFASRKIFEINDRFVVFALAAFELVFSEPNGNYSGSGVGNAGEASVIDGIFDFVDKI